MTRRKLLVPNLDVRSINENELQKIREDLIASLVELLKISCSLVNDEKKAISIFADLISVIYKLPMLMSYTPHTGLSTPFEYFFIYVIARHYTEIKFSNVEELLNELEKIKEQRENEYNRLFSYANTLREIYEKLLYTPVDMRPGYNFISLVSHLQLTSILVWLLQSNSQDLNYLRIATLLLEFGKIFNPTNYFVETLNLLNELVDRATCLKSELSKVKELIEKADNKSFLEIIEEADKAAVARDRLEEIVTKALDLAGLDKCKDVCYSTSTITKECSECLERLGEETYKKASQSLYKSLLESTYEDINVEEIKKVIKNWDLIPSKKVEISSSSVKEKTLGYIVYIDFHGVQRFITSFPKLRDMSFASFLVDFITSVYAFAVLDQQYYKNTGEKSRIPAEALLSGYGGHSYIVIRSDFENEGDVKEEVRKLLVNSSPKELDIKLDVRVVEFAYESSGNAYVRNYKEIWDEISSMSYQRYLVDFKEEIYSLGLHRVCDNCGIRPAVEIKDNEYLCKVCSLVRDLSKSRGFVAKLNSTYYIEGDIVEPSKIIKIKDANEKEVKVEEYAMEAIAGYRNVNDTKYVALIKADGNNAGRIFGYTTTFSEYIDKSFRLDYGVKKRFYETLNELLEAEKDKKDLTSRVLVGVLYLGGDDIMLMMPSQIAVPFAVKMFEAIDKESGFTFKVGVISVKPDHPVQFAYKAVNELMESSKLENKSSLGCLVFTSTLATDGVVEAELDKYRGKQNSYSVVSNDIENIKKLLQKVKLLPEEDESKKENIFKEFVEMYYNSDIENVKKKVRDIIRPLEDLSNYAYTHNFYDALAYILRYRARSKKSEQDDIAEKGFSDYKLVSFLFSSDNVKDLVIPLYDYYFVLKTIRVGV